MKKSVFVLGLTAALLACTPAFAQDAKFGIVGGPASNTVVADDGDYKDGVDPAALYSIGLQFDYEFHDFLGIAPELLFSRRGWNTEFGGSVASSEAEWRISYLELPILIRAGVPIGDVVAPKLVVGPQAALFIDGQVDGSAQIFGVSGSDQSDIDSEDIRDLQLGVVAGAGVDINVNEFVITTELRYTRNFSGILEDEDTNDADDNIYHSSWGLMIGLLY
jgi:hypothetical protein